MLLATLGCADLLGVPGAPRLIEEQPPETPVDSATTGLDPGLSPVAPAPPGEPPASSDGVVPAAGLGLVPAAPSMTPMLPATPVAPEAEPPVVDAPAPTDVPEPCLAELAPVDLLLILDNSGSMAAETSAVEQALPAWSQRLAALGLDYRLILLSRHRTQDRSQSEAASTSICVAQPLSGLASCPSQLPVLGERFFHYSIKIDASDSFERALEGLAAPDSAGLAPGGWSQWLRADARQAFIEISDADSDMPALEFAERLAALAPQYFASSEAAGFLFYSVVGLAEKALPDEPYLPDEAIERDECRSADTRPDNAGEEYQALSVLTGGLRFPLCRLDALGSHLEHIGADLLQKARRCTAPAPAE